MSSAFYSVYIEDTIRYIVRMAPGFLLAAVTFCCLYNRRMDRLLKMELKSSKLREGTLLLFWLFCGGMAILTLTPGWFDWLPLIRGLKPEHGPFFSLGSWNLVPHLDLFGGLWSTYMLLGNIIMFVPFGFFAALLWRGYTWKRALLTGLAITGSIECWQIFVGRAFDIDDLMLNTLGVLVGYWMWRVLFRVAPRFTGRFQCGAARPTPR